jgi:hypothetical protein
MRRGSVLRTFKRAPACSAVVVVAISAACGSAAGHGPVVSAAPPTSASTAPAQVTQVTQVTNVSAVKPSLPAGFGSPRVVAGDIIAGAWFLASSTFESRIFHVAPGGTLLDSWMIADWTNGKVGPPVTGAMAEDPAGRVWLGAEQTLYQLDPSSGTTKTFQLPPLNTIPALEARRQSELQGTQNVDGLAVSSSGEVAITLTGASQYFVVRKDGSVVKFDLPSGTEAISVVYDDADVAIIALRSYTDNAADLVFRANDSPATVSVPDSNAITAAKGTVIAGQKTLTDISDTGGTTSRAVADAVNLDPGGSPPKGLPDGGLAVSTTGGGIARLDTTGAVHAMYQMPTLRCLLDKPPDVAATGGDDPTDCVPSAEQMAVDGAGGVWIIPSIDTGGLYLAAAP